jgi:hypothetical protein
VENDDEWQTGRRAVFEPAEHDASEDEERHEQWQRLDRIFGVPRVRASGHDERHVGRNV